MSISFGGLGLMSLRRPFSELVGIVLGKRDLQSMLCLAVFCIVFFVLAYLTNPSENSFRAYLTELSFRQHLSRLDDNTDDDPVVQETSSSNLSFRTGTVDSHRTLPFDNRSPFHFANRASVSLRTPKHVFHSFGIFTIAAIIPLAKTDRALQDQHDGTTVCDSWFIGAFGKWWRGGVFETWYQDVIARSGDEESWSSGILGMKTLDRLNELNGLPFSTRNLPLHGLSRGSPPRLRNREKSSQRNISASTRSSSPPPLPKSVSLPLHAPRTIQSPLERNGTQIMAQSHSSPASSEQISKPAAPPPSSFDQSPRVVDLLHQISASQTTILDLRTQLNESQSAASQVHASLQADLVSFRERKRQEDAAKNDLKSRTKTLEDSKRAAESTRRDAEKRLRFAENARNDAAQRIGHLDKEIAQLQNRLSDDTSFLIDCQNNKSDAEQALAVELEHKKKEIKVAENVVAALSLRARELEGKLVQKKERLRSMFERVEAQKEQASSPIEHFDTWSSVDLLDQQMLVHSRDASGYAESSETVSSDGISFGHGDGIVASRPFKSTVNLVSDFNESSLSTKKARNQGYFDRPMNILGRPSLPLNFSPFDEIPQTPTVVISPLTSSSLISSSLISSLNNDDGLSRSFQSDSDIFLERDWREKNTHTRAQSLQRPEVNITCAQTTDSPTADGFDNDPFEVRVFAPDEHDRFAQPKDHPLRRNNSDPSNTGHINADTEPVVTDKTHNRRWFSLSAKTKAKKGLNPDAKVFDFNRSQSKPGSAIPKPVIPSVSPPVYDALNPNGLGTTLLSSTTTDSHFLRAFAPSPAEREALQRALGGSSNGSLERLPSLSDVGSIPSSPSHIHAKAVDHSPPFEQPQRHVPSWLQSLPRIRKPNFSPWDDEEFASTATPFGSGSHRFLGGKA
ncbi:hypothetical protein J3R30DRAFT_3306048 [Lentinula aciculospora]|uniref:Proteophosphoglycan ppg4 n=1 Tax=Lentinula aciculospora TaxID=153920 RepID=A0A9W8ZWL0_9AGAR|nr:hypothetical protein J3R30DRAFT_3306048 [Lentinula aciculospora]